MTDIYLKSHNKCISVEETVDEIATQMALINLPGFLVLHGLNGRKTLIDVGDISAVLGAPE